MYSIVFTLINCVARLLIRWYIQHERQEMSRRLAAPPVTLMFTQNLDNTQPRLAKKWGNFGDAMIAHYFPKISGESWTICRRLGSPYFER